MTLRRGTAAATRALADATILMEFTLDGSTTQTVTDLYSSDLTGQANDYWNTGCQVVLVDTSVGEVAVARDITDFVASTGRLTVDTLPFTPLNGDRGFIVRSAGDSAADIAAVKAETALIVADTNEVQLSLANGGFTDLLIDAIKADTAAVLVDTAAMDIVRYQSATKNTIAASNAGYTAMLTVGTAAIWVHGATIRANQEHPALTTAAMEKGDALGVIITTAEAPAASLNAAGATVNSSRGPLYCKVGDTLGLDLLGTGPTATSLDIDVLWTAAAAGATLA